MAPVARRLPDHHVLERANKPASTTTTVSTIAMQSGSTRLVIAILQAGTQIDLKVLLLDQIDGCKYYIFNCFKNRTL
jgi:hypothetical protein